MFHLSSILPLTAALRAGSRYVTMVDFEVDAAVKQIVERARHVHVRHVPDPEPGAARPPRASEAPTSHPCGSSTRWRRRTCSARSRQALPHAIQVSAYGCTELGGIISQNDPRETPEQRATSCGTPVPGDRGPHRRPRDRARPARRRGGRDRRPAASGCSRATTTIPSGPPRRSTPGGWFHTGDLGSVDEDGRIAYHGRTKDMLKVGGENVAALEVESYLCAASGRPARAGRRASPTPRLDRGAGRVRRARARARA